MKVADITAEQLSDYEEKLSAIRSSAGIAFKTFALEQELSKLGEEARKSTIYHAANKAVSHLSDAAGSVACDFFDAHVTGAAPSEIAPLPKFIKRRLYEHIEKYAKTHEIGDDEFMRLLAEEVGGEAVQHANRTTVHNAAKNDVRYARVPFGNSCAFCLMLASRGFVYHSATTAGEDKGHYHGNCRCKIVAGKEGTEIEGYNPEALNRRMQQIAEELDITNFNWEDYMSDKAMQDLLQREIRLRDQDWLLTGKPLVPDNSSFDTTKMNKQQLHAYKKDNATASILAKHGLPVTMTDNPLKKQKRGVPQFDFLINNLHYESKSPEGDGYLAVAGNIVKADNKFLQIGKKSHVVLSNLNSKMDDDKFLRYFNEAREDFRSDWNNVEDIILVMKEKAIQHIYL